MVAKSSARLTDSVTKKLTNAMLLKRLAAVEKELASAKKLLNERPPLTSVHCGMCDWVRSFESNEPPISLAGASAILQEHIEDQHKNLKLIKPIRGIQ